MHRFWFYGDESNGVGNRSIGTAFDMIVVKIIRKTAVVSKRTTAVYAEAGRNPLFKCVLQSQK